MHVPTFLPYLFSLLSIVRAMALNPRQDSSNSTSYILRSCVVNGTSDTGSPKGGLYLTHWHEYAGVGIAALQPNITEASVASLNIVGELLFLPFGDLAPNFPYGMVLDYGTAWNDVAWAPVELNEVDVPDWTPGFFFDATGLQNNMSLGWLACDWWYGVPQIFWVNNYIYDFVMPSSCSTVDLVPVYQ